MDQDDPEKRIADLERQLGEQRRGADLPPVAPHGSGAPSEREPSVRRLIVARALVVMWLAGGIALLLWGFGVIPGVGLYAFKSLFLGSVMILIFIVIAVRSR